jgi:hypothetical protein
MATASMSLPETRNICFGFILSMRRKRMHHSLTGFALAFSFPSTLIFAVDCS